MSTEELKAQLRAALAAARDIAGKAEAESRDLTGEEMTGVKARIEEARGLKTQIDAAEEGAGLMAALKGLDGVAAAAEPPAASGGPAATGRKSTGERFAESDVFRSFMAAHGGRIPESAKGLNSGPVSFGGMRNLVGAKVAAPGSSLITGDSATSAGGLLVPDWLGLVDSYVGPPLVMRQLVTNGTTGTDTVEFVRETARTYNAAVVPEAVTENAITSSPGNGGVSAADGGLKPESALGLAKDSTTVKTIAHWIPATKRALSDAGQIVTLINEFLRTGLDEALEEQIITGTGEDEDFTGVLETEHVQSQEFDTDLLTTARKAKTKVRVVGRSVPTAYVLNPEDNETVDLLTNDEGNFYFGGPSAAGSGMTLWGLPRVESEYVPAGTAIVANWRSAVLLDREQSSIQVSDSHADFFVRNLVAFLAELRAAFFIRRPSAFCTFDTAASAPSG